MPKVMELVPKETWEIQDIICDSCGKSCRQELFFYEKEVIKTRPSYKPMFRGDFMELTSTRGREVWSAYLCYDCVDNKLDFINFNKQ